MKRQVRAAGWRLVSRIAPTATVSISEVPGLREQVRRLNRELDQARHRIATLEDEVQEARRLNRRIAELTDIVEEVLLPAADRNDERLRQALDTYAETL